MNRRVRLDPSLFSLLFLGIILYWNSLQTPFLWDEDKLIVADPRVHDWSRFPDIFLKSFFGVSDFYYRPLATLSFRIDHMVWEFNPLGYHLTNLLFHLANTFIVYLLYRHFFKKAQLAFWGAFLFLAHPAHVEAVTYIPSRTDLLSFFFFLASFYFYVKGRGADKKSPLYFGSVLCYALALLSKERATFLPLLVFSHLLLVDREKVRWKGREGALLLSMGCCLVAWAFVRRSVSIRMSLLSALDIPRLLPRLSVLPEILFAYARIWFFPWPLHMGRIIPIALLEVRSVLLGWSCFFFFLAGLLVLFRKALERFWLVWIAVSLLPVVQIFPIYFNPPPLLLAVSEYLLYFASAGIIGLLASRFGSFFVVEGRGGLLKSAPTVLLGATLTLFSFMVIWRNGEYRDRITFFEQTVRYAPYHASAYNHLGLAYKANGDLKEAEKAFQKALSLDPREGFPYANLGLLAYERGEFEKAYPYYQEALMRMPENSVVFHYLGMLEARRGEARKAIQFYEKAIEVEPDALYSYVPASRLYWELGEKEKALEVVNQGLKRDPSHRHLQKIKKWLEERLLIKTL